MAVTGAAQCNSACSGRQMCVGATCLTNNGYPCAQSSDCAGGACVLAYADLDGDGYGTGQAVSVCAQKLGVGAGTPPGYSFQSGDCCDDPNHLSTSKLIHPGADFQTVSAGGLCGITWDYDCSGTVNNNWTTYCGSCTAYPDCQCAFTEYPNPNASACGQDVGGASCGAAQGQCISAGGHDFGTLGCR